MADQFFKSEDVRVFPSAYRSEIPEGKFNSEKNLSGIARSITDNSSYVISHENGILKVVIYGYYFEIALATQTSEFWLAAKFENVGTNVTTSDKIHLDSNLVNYADTSIASKTPLDESGYFKGILGSTSEPTVTPTTDYTVYKLQVYNARGELINTQKMLASNVTYDSSKTVVDAIDEKQNILVAGNGITLGGTGNKDISTTHFNRTNSLVNKGSSNQPVYFNGNGEAVTITTNCGAKGVDESGYIKDENVYFVGGKITGGYNVYASTSSPSSSVGSKGDIWLQYVN